MRVGLIPLVGGAVTAPQRRTLTPDPFPERGTSSRSDPYGLAEVGVPAAHPKGRG